VYFSTLVVSTSTLGYGYNKVLSNGANVVTYLNRINNASNSSSRRACSLFLPEAGQLELVEKQQLLPAHWRFLYQLPQTGVVLAGAGVDDAGQSWQEAGETVLHLLGCSKEKSVEETLPESQAGRYLPVSGKNAPGSCWPSGWWLRSPRSSRSAPASSDRTDLSV